MHRPAFGPTSNRRDAAAFRARGQCFTLLLPRAQEALQRPSRQPGRPRSSKLTMLRSILSSKPVSKRILSHYLKLHANVAAINVCFFFTFGPNRCLRYGDSDPRYQAYTFAGATAKCGRVRNSKCSNSLLWRIPLFRCHQCHTLLPLGDKRPS